MFLFCEMFYFYLTIYYSTAEWSDDDHDFDYDYVNAEELYSHAEIIDQCDFKQVHLIDSCVYSNTTLLQPRENTQLTSDSVSDKGDINDGDHPIQQEHKTFPTLLKLISGTLVGGADFSEIYIDIGDEDKVNSCSENNNVEGNGENINKRKVPTMPEIARKVARLQKTQLDEKQYIAYEMIACTFLLGMVNDGRNPYTKLGKYLQQSMAGSTDTATNIEDIIKQLKARGGREQMLMFLTGPAGSGKSTAVMVSQHFCYEFCLAVGAMWSDTTFLFTAYTGAAASLLGGVTISKAAFINQRKPLSQEDRNEWLDVRILIIDEISFMSDSVLKELDKKLKEIGNRTHVFGGFSIIFSGDFRQLEPVCSNEKELLFSSLSSGVWENNINVVLILDNEHRFKDDPQYGQMLKRMWTGDLSKEDRKVINSRVIGYNGLQLPPIFEGKQTENFCNEPIRKKTQQQLFHSRIEQHDKLFIPNWKIMIYSCYHATSKEMLAMHVQQTKNATPYKKHYFKST